MYLNIVINIEYIEHKKGYEAKLWKVASKHEIYWLNILAVTYFDNKE